MLDPLLEEYLRRALLISRGNSTLFFTRPISLAFMIAPMLRAKHRPWNLARKGGPCGVG